MALTARDLDQLGEKVGAVEVGMMAALVVWSMSVVVAMAWWMVMSWMRFAVAPVSVVFLVVVVVVVVLKVEVAVEVVVLMVEDVMKRVEKGGEKLW